LNYLCKPIIPLAPLAASLSLNFSAKAYGSMPEALKLYPFLDGVY
jgi:hypothetical protein